MRLLPLAGALLLSLLGARAAPAQEPPLDLLVRGGRIADGTGNPAFVGDVGLRGDRIVLVGRAGKHPPRARRTIDAAGLVVAPGFVDIHSHADPSLLVDGEARSAVHQGITSVIVGEGPSMAPSREFPTFRAYFDRLLERGISVNLGSYVGSSQIWTEVHGAKAGPPSPEARLRMQALVRRTMEDGALGVSSSLSGPPGSWIDTDTLVAMCQAAAPYGGIYSTHLRHEGLEVWSALDEALAIGRRARIPVDVIHLKISEHTLWGQMPRLVGKLAAARAAGADVQANVYPYWAGQNDLATIVPPWAHEGGAAALVARLKDQTLRPRLRKEITGGLPGWYNHYTATGSWEGMLLASLSNPAYKRFEGKRMSEVIATLGREGRGDGAKDEKAGAGDPFEIFFQVLIDNGGSVPTVYFHHAEKDMVYALQQPFVSVGSDGGALRTDGPLSAGHPHPRFYGTFPRVLGRYVRDQKALTLEEAVRKITSANAAKVNQLDRGLLRPGLVADLAVFDPARVTDKATFEKPHQYSEGVKYLVVAGQLVLDNGRHTAARPGRILYGPGKR